ncbi:MULTISPECIES: hypothetical protein [Plantibacter]|uniref:hypothetical protein n=1 Tax=Plantibacter TaxID=190323 RepID=UPI0011103653|nr:MULTISPECIES: hypothetical protein [Plantibacter]CAH0271937.1 hypothetical protein SRABI02_03702 [Plantibacter cousiniae]
MAAKNEPISARACAILSIAIAAFSIYLVAATARDGGSWTFSVLACFVPLLFAAQGIRMSRQPGARWPTFSLIGSIVGAALGLVSFAAFAWLLVRS